MAILTAASVRTELPFGRQRHAERSQRVSGEAARLNLGCGHDIREGYVNVDAAPLPGVDVVHDLNRLPLPFADERFDEVNCKDVLEHVDYIPLLREIHRLLRP